MTLSTRIEACRRLIQTYEAEEIGLCQALIGKPLPREAFSTEHEWHGYSRGWEEGRSILEKGEGK